jgi:hypothetical protein
VTCADEVFGKGRAEFQKRSKETGGVVQGSTESQARALVGPGDRMRAEANVAEEAFRLGVLLRGGQRISVQQLSRLHQPRGGLPGPRDRVATPARSGAGGGTTRDSRVGRQNARAARLAKEH